MSSISKPQGVRSRYLSEEGGELVIVAGRFGQRDKQAMQMLGQARQRIVLGSLVPDDETSLSETFDYVVQRLGLQGVKNAIEVVASNAALRNAGQLHEAPQSELDNVACAAKKPPQGQVTRPKQIQLLATDPGSKPQNFLPRPLDLCRSSLRPFCPIFDLVRPILFRQ